MKMLMRLVVVLVILAVVLVAALFFYVDSLAKTAIERGGTHALGVETTLSSADVGIMGGTFGLAGLNVANPPDFDGERFLALGHGDVTVSLATLRDDIVRLPTLALGDLDLSLERKAGKANYDVILANLKRLETGDPPKTPSDGDGRKFVIQEVVISDIDVTVDLVPLGGSLTRVDVPIEEIRLKDVGSESDTGVLLSELISIVMKAVFASVLEAGADLLPADLLNDLGGHLEQLESLTSLGVDVAATAQGQLMDVTGEVEAAVSEVGKGVQEAGKAAEDALKGIGDLFGEKKDK